ncbi:MAG: hypothetical protein B7Y42_07975 [Polaromonas sp. 28-63-22]|nr:MAG: hypothetical protein B7Y42_07975 [Polaromonas sp. 28-63-22]
MKASRALRLQGMVFSGLAGLFVIASFVLPRVDSRIEISVIATLIFLLGVPHGALDTIFARRLYPIRSMREWLIFSFAYVALAMAVVALWWLLPNVFLTAFLLVSAFHFSGDPVTGTPSLLRFWYGGAIIVLPTLIHENEVAVLFGYLVPGDFAMQSATVLHWMAVPWLIGLSIAVIWNLRRNLLTGVEVIAVALLVSVTTPLMGFTLFFCAMHSVRHTIRTQKFAGERSYLWILTQAILPMVFSALIAVAIWPTFGDTLFDAAVVQLLFVALAALTVPHMWLIERIRFSGEFRDLAPLGIVQK